MRLFRIITAATVVIMGLALNIQEVRAVLQSPPTDTFPDISRNVEKQGESLFPSAEEFSGREPLTESSSAFQASVTPIRSPQTSLKIAGADRYYWLWWCLVGLLAAVLAIGYRRYYRKRDENK